MLTSLFFVVAGFLEFAFVLQLHRHNEKEAIDKNNMETTTRNGLLTVMDEPQKQNTESTSNVNIISRHEKPKLAFIAFVVGL